MRYIKDIILEHAVIHVIDTMADEPIISTKMLRIDEHVETFARKHVKKCLNSSDTYAARFVDVEKGMFATTARELIDNPDYFKELSRRYAIRLFNTIKNSEVSSCDLLCVQYIADEQRCFGFMKMDHQNNIGHHITFDEDKLVVNLNDEIKGLPGTGQSIQKAVFFTKGQEDIEMIIIDKYIKSEEAKADYFMKEYLEAVVVPDYVSKSRTIKPLIERWVQRNLDNQIKEANKIRSYVRSILASEKIFKVDELKEMFTNESYELYESLKEFMKDYSYNSGDEFHIDKVFIEKVLKKKTVRTDTGVTIASDQINYLDPNKIVIKENEDGTIDYIIKNVRNIVES